MPGENLPTAPPPSKANWASGLRPWLAWSVGLVGLLLIPAGILDIALTNSGYLPSAEWLQVSRPAVYALWLVWGVAILFVVGRSGASAAVRLLVAFGCLTLFAPSVGDLVRSGIPALFATISGTEVQHKYRILRAGRSSTKFCRTPVEVEGMPFMTMLCGVGNEFRSHLSPGQTVIFGGKGTWMGLYVDHTLPN